MGGCTNVLLGGCVLLNMVNIFYIVILMVQEFMILPTGATSFKEAMKMGVEVYHNLKVIS